MTVPAELRSLFADLRLSMEGVVVDGVWRARRDEDGVAVVVKMCRSRWGSIRCPYAIAGGSGRLWAMRPPVYERRLLPGHVVSVMRWEEVAHPKRR